MLLVYIATLTRFMLQRRDLQYALTKHIDSDTFEAIVTLCKVHCGCWEL